MKKINFTEDAFGHALWDAYNGKFTFEIMERNDGWIAAQPAYYYFLDFENWWPHQQKAIKHVKGKVLDIGCGPAMHAVYLQSQRLDVLGIDVSRLAIKIAKMRGLQKAKVLSIDDVGRLRTKFDTILLLGNNWGLMRNLTRARKALDDLYKITSDEALIIAESYSSKQSPHHLKYQRENFKNGRLPGQERVRIRYNLYCSQWFDFLFSTTEEIELILKGTGWSVRKYFQSGQSKFIAIIYKG